MDEKELYERVLAELRGLSSGESLSADGLAEEIDEPESVVAEVLAILHSHNYAWCSGRGCYSPSPKCRKATIDEIMSELGGCKTDKDHLEPDHEPTKVKHRSAFAPVEGEVKPPENRRCQYCGKELEPNKINRHENMCGKNPGRPNPAAPPNAINPSRTMEDRPVEIAQESFPPKVWVSDPVPSPSEYVEGFEMDGGTITWSADNEDEYPPQLQDIPTVEQILGQQQAVEDPTAPDEMHAPDNALSIKVEAIALTGSPGMSALLRLLSCCQKAADEGADLTLDAHVKVADGFYVDISMDIPVEEDP